MKMDRMESNPNEIKWMCIGGSYGDDRTARLSCAINMQQPNVAVIMGSQGPPFSFPLITHMGETVVVARVDDGGNDDGDDGGDGIGDPGE